MAENEYDVDAAEWWEGIAQDELRYQECGDCASPIFYPRTRCPKCFSADLHWRASRGSGVVHALTVVHRAPGKQFADDVPYVVALVDLDEGFRMLSRVVDADPQSVAVGNAVKVVFRDGPDGRRLPYFAPSGKE
jgi:uncharacterized protein